MKTLAGALTTQASATAQAPALLVEVAAWGGATVRWTDSDADITYSTNLYDARPLTLADVEVSPGGDPQAVTLRVANQDLTISVLCATADPRGCAVKLLRVFLDNLTVAQTIADGLVIVSYRLSEDAAEFHLELLADLFAKPFPRRTFDRVCPWTFKGTECAYAGADSACAYTLDDCRARTGGSNSANFGGFPEVRPVR